MSQKQESKTSDSVVQEINHDRQAKQEDMDILCAWSMLILVKRGGRLNHVTL